MEFQNRILRGNSLVFRHVLFGTKIDTRDRETGYHKCLSDLNL